MKRYVSIVIVSLFLLLWAVLQFMNSRNGSVRAQNQGSQTPAQSSPTSQPSTPEASSSAQPAPNLADASQSPPVQAKLDCAGCHGPGKQTPYLAGQLFHFIQHRAYDPNIHAQKLQNGRPAATCLDCHSNTGDTTGILPASDPKSTLNRANIAQTCGRCHTQPVGTFHDSIHGQAQARGINASATCSDCHGSHDIYPAKDERSLLSKARTPETCARCHTSILSEWHDSSHFAALQRNDPRAPVCTTCHTGVSHATAPVNLREFDFEIVQQCSKCHERQAPSYRDTFHGQAVALGYRPAATCVDCHTPHRNLPAEDLRSSVNQANLVQTCAKCHQNANTNFVSYDPHPEPNDPNRSLLLYVFYKFMTWLFIIVFGFFGLHTLLWLQRSLVGLFRGETRRAREGDEWVTRFNKSNRWTHVTIVISFLILAATGLPLMFYYTGWGQNIVRYLGGVGVTRVLHRIFAVVTFGYAFYHLGYLLWLYFVKKERGLLFGPNSMVPRPRDLQDLYHMFRWFLYKEKRPPKFDRWTYWEKFDYFAVFWGIPVIGLSGLMLWLPGFFSRIMPGSILNVAMIVHGEEALLATGFIFAFHFFHNHMRPENFPLDTSIFTGKIPLERFKEERRAEYVRMKRQKRLGEIMTTPPTARQRLFAKLFGFTAYIVGLVLVVWIFTTFLFLR
jgi:cytochrome b subunit of formate dehydrogenase/nitrate/TMAO reductase-like tetraheme cytochrome c subunit